MPDEVFHAAFAALGSSALAAELIVAFAGTPLDMIAEPMRPGCNYVRIDDSSCLTP
jgi:hypothetical protein